MQDLYQHISDSLNNGRDLCLVTIIRQTGSAPRHLGARCLVYKDASQDGTIGGGVMEAQAVEAAAKALAQDEPQVLTFDLSSTLDQPDAMICGGNAQVWLQPLRASDSQTREVFSAAAKMAARGRRGILVSSVNNGQPSQATGRFLLVSEGRAPLGSQEVLAEVSGEIENVFQEITSHTQPRLLNLAASGDLERLYFLEPLSDKTVVYIFGAGHVAHPLAKMVKMLGFDLVVADDRPDFANQERFPEADEIWVDEFSRILEKHELGPGSYAIIMTRGHAYDKEVLGQVLRRDTAYVGMIGSERKRNQIYGALKKQGVSQEQIDTVHSPIGLDIGAETPEEIAVSVAAELVAIRTGCSS